MHQPHSSHPRSHVGVLFWTLVLWMGIGVAWIAGEPVSAPDTSDYLLGETGILSFVGDAVRPWPTVLFFAPTSSPIVLTLLMFLLYGASWTALLWACLRRTSTVVAWVSGGLLVALGLSPILLQWNLMLLSESLTISLVLLGMAGVYESTTAGSSGRRRRSAVAGSIGLAALFLATVNRPPLALIFIGAAAVFALTFRASHRRVLPMAMIASVTILGVLYAAYVDNRINDHWGRMSRVAVSYLYLTADGTARQGQTADPLLAHILEHGPSCLANYRASWTIRGKNPFEVKPYLGSECPDGAQWLSDNFSAQYMSYVATHPRYALHYALAYLPGVSDPYSYAAVTSIVPASVSLLYTAAPSDKPGTGAVPILGWIALFVLMTGGSVALRRRRAAHGDEVVVWLLLGAGSLLAMFASVFLINTETMRIASPAMAGLISATILLAGSIGRAFVQDDAPADHDSD